MYEDVKVCKQRPFYRETTFFAFEYHWVEDGKMGEDKREAKVRSSNSSVSINFKHGSTGSLKKVPKTASIECCARPPVPQVMKVCFTLVLGHRYETCTLVFYRGVFKEKTVA